MNGYTGKILMVDLTAKTSETIELGDDVYRSFIGGYGLAAKVLYDEIPEGADPLGPDNIIALTPGLLTGTPALFSGRYMASAKSPLTGGWGDANGGGTFGPAIKKAGWDGLFFKGKADSPVYVHVDGDKIEILDGNELWGKSTIDTENYLKDHFKGTKIKMVSIGPASEKLSLISGIFNDGGRCAARSGLGSVMGSKNLKAVVVSGRQKLNLADKSTLLEINKDFKARLNDSFLAKLFDSIPALSFVAAKLGAVIGKSGLQTKLMPPFLATVLKKYGTPGFMAFYTGTGEAPIKNWKGSPVKDFSVKQAGKISDDAVTDLQTKKYHCANCPIGCGGTVKYKIDGSSEKTSHKPEYETLVGFGSLCLVDDISAICEANHMCNCSGLDTISTGNTIAFAMECYEEGILSKEDLGGIDLEWGNSRAMLQLLQKMIDRDGIGDVLADGVKKAAEQIGKGSDKFAMHVGGQEMGFHDPRVDPGFGLAYQLEPTPGRHTISAYAYQELYDLHKLFPDEGLKSVPHVITKKWKMDETEKAKRHAVNSKYSQLINCAGLCKLGALTAGPHFPIFQWMNAATGWDMTNGEYLKAGERIQTIRQAFNKREKTQEFKLPERISVSPTDAGPIKNVNLKLSNIKKEYFKEFKWDEESAEPSDQVLKDLGIKK